MCWPRALAAVTPSLELGTDVALSGNNRLRAFLRGDITLANTKDVFVDATFNGADFSDGTFRNYGLIGDNIRSLAAGATIYSNDNRMYFSIGYRGDWADSLKGNVGTIDFGIRF